MYNTMYVYVCVYIYICLYMYVYIYMYGLSSQPWAPTPALFHAGIVHPDLVPFLWPRLSCDDQQEETCWPGVNRYSTFRVVLG